MKNESVAVLIHYRALPEVAEAAANELAKLIEIVAAEERDCLSIVLHRNPDDPSSLMLYERWTDSAAYLGEHIQTPHILSFMERAPEFFDGPPQISIWESLSEV
jgi:quinol monooxygenase YgiN